MEGKWKGRPDEAALEKRIGQVCLESIQIKRLARSK